MEDRERQLNDMMVCIVGMVCIVVLALLTGGCKVRERIVEVRSDSIAERVVRVVEIDTITAYLPRESFAVVRMDSSYLATRYAESEATIDSLGYLHHSLKNLPTPIKVVTLNRTDTIVRDVVKVDSREVVKQAPLHWWQRYWWGVALIPVVAYTIFRLVRRLVFT